MDDFVISDFVITRYFVISDLVITSGGARVKRAVGPGGARHNSGGANYSDKISINKYIRKTHAICS